MTRSSHTTRNGAVLLDVVLALGLFVGMAAVMSGALNMSVKSTQRLRDELAAENLAVTVMSEIQAAMRHTEAIPNPQPFLPPNDAWTLQLIPHESSNIEIVIQQLDGDVEYRLSFLHLAVQSPPVDTEMIP